MTDFELHWHWEEGVGICDDCDAEVFNIVGNEDGTHVIICGSCGREADGEDA